MYSLPLPPSQLAEVYADCIERTSDTQLRLNLQSESARVLQRGNLYEQMARQSSLFQIAAQNAVHVTNVELSNLYGRVLVSGGARNVYNAIRSASRFGRCPLCAQRDVQTLDHYLPKTSFPEYSILPMNLVPCCFECNHAKGAHMPVTSNEQLFHPYFDDWGHLELIHATINFDNTVYAEFNINENGLPRHVSERARRHFEGLKLGALYSDHASVELVQKRDDFIMTYQNGGPGALRAELLRESESRRAPFPNTWQPILYRALSESEQFINEGFWDIEETQ